MKRLFLIIIFLMAFPGLLMAQDYSGKGIYTLLTTNYSTTAVTQAYISGLNYVTTAALTAALSPYALITNYYDKTAVDSLLAAKLDASAITNYYTALQVDALLLGKASTSSVALKANSADVYTTGQTDALLNDKASTGSVVLKADLSYVNSNFGTTAAVLLKADKSYVDFNFGTTTAVGLKANSTDVAASDAVNLLKAQTRLSTLDFIGSAIEPALPCDKIAGCLVDGNYLYMANGIDATFGGVSIFNIQNKTNPILLSSFSMPTTQTNGVISMNKKGNILYIGTSGGYLAPVDVSNPYSPIMNTPIKQTGALAKTYNFQIVGNYAYCASQSIGFGVFDITNATAPVCLYSQGAVGNSVAGVAVKGNYAYVTRYTGGNSIVIWDITNPAAPTVANTVPCGLHPVNIKITGNYAFVADSLGAVNTFKIFDLSNATNPVLISTNNTAGAPGVNGSIFVNKYPLVYIMTNGTTPDIEAWDCSNVTAPVMIAAYNTGLGANMPGGDISNGYIYTGEYSNRRVGIYSDIFTKLVAKDINASTGTFAKSLSFGGRDVSAEIGLKADKSYVDGIVPSTQSIGLKADKSYVDSQDAAITASVALKIDRTAYFDATHDGTVKTPGVAVGHFLRDDNTFASVTSGGGGVTNAVDLNVASPANIGLVSANQQSFDDSAAVTLDKHRARLDSDETSITNNSNNISYILSSIANFITRTSYFTSTLGGTVPHPTLTSGTTVICDDGVWRSVSSIGGGVTNAVDLNSSTASFSRLMNGLASNAQTALNQIDANAATTAEVASKAAKTTTDSLEIAFNSFKSATQTTDSSQDVAINNRYTKSETNTAIANATASVSVNQTVTATAGENLTSGQVVSLINNSGTMQAWHTPLTVNTSPNGAEYAWNAAATTNCSAVALDSTRFFVSYQEGTAIKGVVGTVSGSTIAYGSVASLYASGTNSLSTSCLLNTNKVLTCFYNDTNTRGLDLVSTISGNAITSTNADVFGSGSAVAYPSVTKLATDTALLCWKKGTNSGRAVIITVSGTTPTTNAEAEFNAAATAYISCSSLSATSAIVAFSDGGDSSYGHAKILTISGTTIDASATEYTYSGTEPIQYGGCTALSATSAFIVWQHGGSPFYGKCVSATITGTAIAYSSVATINAADSSRITCNKIDSTKALIAFRDNGAAGAGASITATISGTSTPTFGTKTNFNASATLGSSICCLDGNKSVIAFDDSGDSDYGKATVNTWGTLLYNQISGISQGAYSTGQTATVLCSGLDANQSGLNPGENYYVAADFSLTTAPVNLMNITNGTGVKIGTAKSATQLIVAPDYK